MRLEPRYRVSIRYTEGAWLRPFGAAEGAGFGWGEGAVSGEILISLDGQSVEEERFRQADRS